jgi:hypothetical protein
MVSHFFMAPEPELVAALWGLARSRTTSVAHAAMLSLGSLGRNQPAEHGPGRNRY